VKVKGAKIPRARQAQADALIAEWRPILAEIRQQGGPARPAQARVSPGVTISNPAFAYA
jgi:hypothetical protein